MPRQDSDNFFVPGIVFMRPPIGGPKQPPEHRIVPTPRIVTFQATALSIRPPSPRIIRLSPKNHAAPPLQAGGHGQRGKKIPGEFLAPGACGPPAPHTNPCPTSTYGAAPGGRCTSGFFAVSASAKFDSGVIVRTIPTMTRGPLGTRSFSLERIRPA